MCSVVRKYSFCNLQKIKLNESFQIGFYFQQCEKLKTILIALHAAAALLEFIPNEFQITLATELEEFYMRMR